MLDVQQCEEWMLQKLPDSFLPSMIIEWVGFVECEFEPTKRRVKKWTRFLNLCPTRAFSPLSFRQKKWDHYIDWLDAQLQRGG